MVLARHLYRRLMRRGRVIALISLSAVPGLIFWLAAFDTDKGELPDLYTNIVASVGYTFAIAALILTAATLRDEKDSGTLPYIYMRPMRRVTFAVQSLLGGMAAALVIGVSGWLVSALAALAVGGDLGMALPALTLFVAAAVGYAAIFVPLGYLVPRSLLVGLGYILVVEEILARVVSGLAQVSIWRIALSMYGDLEARFGEIANESLGPVTPGVGGAAAKLGVAMLLGLAALTWALRRRDAL